MSEYARPRMDRMDRMGRVDRMQIKRRRVSDNAENDFISKTIRQLIVCVLIAATLFGVSKVEVQVCKDIIAGVNNTLAYTVNYKSAAGLIAESAKKAFDFFSKGDEKSEEEAPGTSDSLNTDSPNTDSPNTDSPNTDSENSVSPNTDSENSAPEGGVTENIADNLPPDAGE